MCPWEKHFPRLFLNEIGDVYKAIKCLRSYDDIPRSIYFGYNTDICQPEFGTLAAEALSIMASYVSESVFVAITKNPGVLLNIDFPENVILGTTLESNWIPEGLSRAPGLSERISAIRALKEMGNRIVISISPIMEFDHSQFLNILLSIRPDLIIIGTLNKKDPEFVARYNIANGIDTMNLVRALDYHGLPVTFLDSVIDLGINPVPRINEQKILKMSCSEYEAHLRTKGINFVSNGKFYLPMKPSLA
jgi:hypothetical protein